MHIARPTVVPKRSLVAVLIVAGCGVGFGRAASADEPAAKPVKQLILPGESFLVGGRPAFVMLPPAEKRREPQPWVFYGPTLPPYPDQAEKWMHEQFLAAGVAVAGIDVGEAYGSPKSVEAFTALYTELTERRGFANRPCMLGRSRGGLWVSSWAIANPDKVAGIAGIYPVFDWRTYPGVDKAAPAYGLTPEQLAARHDELNPVARLDVLAKAKIPVYIIHGDADTVVPLKENSAELLRRYKEAGVEDLVTLNVAVGQGHNFWEGFFRCQPLVDFAITRAIAGADAVASKPATVPDKTVVLTFDDSVASHATFVAPLLKKLGFSATFFITEGFEFASDKTHYMTWAQIKQLHDDGFEIGNHTWNHAMVGGLSPEKLLAEVERIEQQCAAHGIPRPVSFCYPAYQTSPAAVKLLRERGYLFARTGGARPFDPARDNPLLMPQAFDSKPGVTLERFAAAVAGAKDGKIAVITFHGVPDVKHRWVDTDPALFEQFMQHLKDHGYTTITVRDMAKYLPPAKAE